MIPEDSWKSLIEKIKVRDQKEMRRQELANAIQQPETKCQACGGAFDADHQTFSYVDAFGRLMHRCETLPNPDAVTEEELAYVRRSILGDQETT